MQLYGPQHPATIAAQKKYQELLQAPKPSQAEKKDKKQEPTALPIRVPTTIPATSTKPLLQDRERNRDSVIHRLMLLLPYKRMTINHIPKEMMKVKC